MSRQPPPIPPRTYPAPPPSNLPALLACLLRVFSWASGASTILLLGYYRFLLPRLTQSLGARHKLKLHQSDLINRLKAGIDQLKGVQEEARNAFPPLEHETPPTDSTSPAPSTQSLEDLRAALSRGSRERNKFAHTFKALTDLTGFLSRETFTLYGTRSSFRHGYSGGHTLSPAEEDVRREIRALKGLVLNRRSFAPSPYRQPAA